MAEKSWLGEFEQIVLLAVLQLGNTAYGFAIQQEIQSRIGRSCSLGALATTLDRMEQKGLVSSRYGDPTPERGGRAKKFFRVEAAGQIGLRESLKASKSMAAGLEPLFGGSL